MTDDLLIHERSLISQNYQFIAGVDEAGRGPWVGSVYAAAVIFNPDVIIDGINDSKKLNSKKRNYYFDLIVEKALSFSIVSISPRKIDEINILQATLLAMKNALDNLNQKPDYVLIDGNKAPDINIPHQCLIKGDSLSQSIAAASILAKVSRDRSMIELEKKYPQFQFTKHKGYGTKLHREELDRFGPTTEHRMSFNPMKMMVKKS